MKALLDTHTLIWLADTPPNLPEKVITLCEDANNELYISIASFWELSIKLSLGKIELEKNALIQLKNWCEDNAISVLPIALEHCVLIQSMPFHHRDPFDRLIIAQAINEQLSVISCDKHFAKYEVPVLW